MNFDLHTIAMHAQHQTPLVRKDVSCRGFTSFVPSIKTPIREGACRISCCECKLRTGRPRSTVSRVRIPVPGCRVAPIKTRPMLLDYLAPKHSQIWTPDRYW